MSEEFNNGEISGIEQAEGADATEQPASQNTGSVGSNTTYSWVNPRINAQAREHGVVNEEMEKHAAERVEGVRDVYSGTQQSGQTENNSSNGPVCQPHAWTQSQGGGQYTQPDYQNPGGGQHPHQNPGGGQYAQPDYQNPGGNQYRESASGENVNLNQQAGPQSGSGYQYHQEDVRNQGGNQYQNGSQSQRGYYHVNDSVQENPHVRPQKKRRTKKPAGPMSMGKRWAVNISMAVVFGLIAGSVAYGVYYAGNKANGGGSTPVIQNTAVASGSEGTDGVKGTGATGSEGGYTVAEVAKNAMPSMVAISTETVETVQSFFGTYSQTVPASGSGVIVGQNDDELLIATNNHVVEGANKVSVAFIDDTTVEAQIKGTDSDNDLAVVAVDLGDIPQETMEEIKIATLGDSDALQIGEGVVAIGNALGYGQSVTNGIVSAVNRTVQTQSETTGETTESDGLIQTNAAINPGNSGGALLNMKGELIGINEAKYSSTSVEGMGFAIPLAKAEPILENLMSMQTRSKVSDSDASYIGITGKNVSAEISSDYGVPIGVLVSTVEADGPADKAGIKERDVITSLDGRNIKSMADLKGALEYYAKGETVEVTIQRMDDGEYKEQTVSVTLGDRSRMKVTDEPQRQPQSDPFGN